MSRRRDCGVIAERVHEHPAVRAWSRLQPDLPPPEAVELLRSADHKTPVVRLVRSGGDGLTVVAKKAALPEARVEKAMYENIAKYLSVPTLRCYGCVGAGDNSCWVFTEDAGGGPFSFENERHRSLAVRWLAALHTSVPRLDGLPDRGIVYYRRRMASARRQILQNTGNPALRDADHALLQRILAHFDLIDRRWETVCALDARLPKGLIHGDFKDGNLRVRETARGEVLLVFDWEEAGWGLPGIDLWRLDTEDYRRTVRARWPGLTRDGVLRLSALGKLLWCLKAIDWEGESLASAWIEETMDWRVRIYEEHLADALERAGLRR